MPGDSWPLLFQAVPARATAAGLVWGAVEEVTWRWRRQRCGATGASVLTRTVHRRQITEAFQALRVRFTPRARPARERRGDGRSGKWGATD